MGLAEACRRERFFFLATAILRRDSKTLSEICGIFRGGEMGEGMEGRDGVRSQKGGSVANRETTLLPAKP